MGCPQVRNNYWKPCEIQKQICLGGDDPIQKQRCGADLCQVPLQERSQRSLWDSMCLCCAKGKEHTGHAQPVQ